jgi:uroporphyrinogen-III synthase
LRKARGQLALALSSSDALDTFVAHAPDDLRTRIFDARILAGSERLAEVARAAGFRDIRVASGAAPADLLAVARDGQPRRAIR